jgi:hydroxypyruvate reductase
MKAGRLAAAAGGAGIVTLVLSDLGDAGWHLVAGGPTLGAPAAGREPLAILDRYRLVPLLPQSVRTFLSVSRRDAPPGGAGNHWSFLLGDVRTAMEGARLEALRLGADVRVAPELLAGEARIAASRLAVAAASAGPILRKAHGARPVVTLFGGETTVTVKGPGQGGRCRELALATALALGAGGTAGGNGCVLVAGTDGVDHLPDAAGAFVDEGTLFRARARGIDPRHSLDSNDSGTFFRSLGDAFAPGPTRTNVGDVAFVLRPAPGRDEDATASRPSPAR